jgi:hypothetical protein
VSSNFLNTIFWVYKSTSRGSNSPRSLADYFDEVGSAASTNFSLVSKMYQRWSICPCPQRRRRFVPYDLLLFRHSCT